MGGSHARDFKCRSISDAACNWPWTTCFDLQNDPQFVVASVGPLCAWERPSCTPRLASTSTEPGNRSTKGPKHRKIYLHLPPPAGCLLVSVTERASRGTLVAQHSFSASYQVGEGGVHHTDNRFKLGASAGSEATQQKSQDTPYLVILLSRAYRPLW